MCLPGIDPISLALLAGGTAASVAGNSMARGEQNDSNARAVQARNAVLTDTLARERKFQDENQAVQSDLSRRYAPGEQDNKLVAANNTRNQDIDSILGVPPSVPAIGADVSPLSGDTPQIVKTQVASKMLNAFQTATAMAKAKANLASYGDVWNANSLATQDAGRKIDSTNAMARGEAAILPAQQDLAEHSVYKPASGTGQALSGIGTLLAGLGGSQFLKKGFG